MERASRSPRRGWADVDRQTSALREAYARAETPEEFRQVGLLCRDIFISLGRVIFDPEKHLPKNEPMPKRDDAKKRLDLAMKAEYGGSENEELRGLVRATYRFVQPRVHDQTEDRTNAMIAADATIHLVKVLAALFPTPTDAPHAEESAELEPGEDYEPEPDWEPDSEDAAAYMEWLDEDDANHWEPDPLG